VNDWRDLRYYEYSPDIDPQGPPTGKDRVYRGGSSYYKAENVRAVSRYGGTPDIRYYYVGFRLVSIKRGR
jgi:formylglycine-generating enzyme required for sulfatase activity